MSGKCGSKGLGKKQFLLAEEVRPSGSSPRLRSRGYQNPRNSRSKDEDDAKRNSKTSKDSENQVGISFMDVVKAQGLDRVATESGLLRNEELQSLKREWGNTRPIVRETHEEFPSIKSTPNTKRRRSERSGQSTGDRGSKGLRHFSMKVCQKVEEKQSTSYNEVADELVKDFIKQKDANGVDTVYDEKNIRRRVYDALNVLMAMDIISKEKKEIHWKGLPSNAKHDLEQLQIEESERKRIIEMKRHRLQELLLQQIAFKNLVKRNASRVSHLSDGSTISLPFILVNTDKETIIQCEMSENRHDIFFNFSAPFEINDDAEVLKRMGMHEHREKDLGNLLPEHLIKYLPSASPDFSSKTEVGIQKDRQERESF